MASLTFANHQARQRPRVGARVNRHHPLASKLVACHLPIPGIGAIDLAGGPTLPIVGNPARVATAYGPGSGAGVSTGYRLTVASGNKLCIQPPFTIAAVIVEAAIGTSDLPIYGIWNSSTDAKCMTLYDGGGGFNGFFLWGNNSGSDIFCQDPSSSSGKIGPRVIMGTGNSTQTEFVDQGATTTTDSAMSTITYGTNNYVQISCDPGFGAGTQTHQFVMGCIWNRVLTAGEKKRFYLDPFQMLQE